MGEAKRRGNFRERKAAAIKKADVDLQVRMRAREAERLKEEDREADRLNYRDGIIGRGAMSVVDMALAMGMGNVGQYGKRKGWRK